MNFEENIKFWFITGLVSIVLILLYRHWRRALEFLRYLRFKFLPIHFMVTLAVGHNSGMNSGIYYSEIKRILLRELEIFGLRNIVTVADFSDIYLFEDQANAEDFRNKKDINLIVWGNFTADGLKTNGENTNVFAPNFTYGYGYEAKNQDAVKSFIVERINHIAQIKKHWIIHDSNSHSDVELLGQNLSILVSFIVGLTVGTRGELDLTISIFEKLYSSLLQRSDSATACLKKDLIQCYILMIDKLTKNQASQKEIKKIAEKIILIDNDNFDGLVYLAFAQYKTGQVVDCKKTIKLLLLKHPKSNLARLDAAFIDIMEGKYGNALRKYNKIFNSKHIEFQPQDVADFLYKEYETCNEPGLIFACGAINYYLIGNNPIAKDDLELFLKKSTLQKYSIMHNQALRILATL